ncbi:MAG: ATP-dependent zinc metalloprotease FtsH [Eubacteriaceae bacterium]|nr:ATP-dependent zinc metalloprotease FtsH [Eubacteriaceae bacterium]
MKKSNSLLRIIFTYGAIFTVLYLIWNNASTGKLFGKMATKEVNYTTLIDYLNDGKFESFEVKMGKNGIASVLGKVKPSFAAEVGSDALTCYAPADAFTGALAAYENSGGEKVPAKYSPLNEDSFFNILLVVSTLVMIGVLLFFLLSQQGGGSGRVINFGKSKARMYMRSDKDVNFDQVAGADEEKEELKEVVDFLKHPEKYNRLGARIPKGVLLVGPPGTGKTLLARATAGEAGVPFFTISGSEFVEMFVGVGASRVRDLFETAKKNAPCILFIDEIDAVGRHRGAGLGGGNDEREQTLNQLLVEMDGFSNHQGIIIIAATNRADILDPALLRPGRFDRQITVSLPDARGRESILKVHAQGKPCDPEISFRVIAKSTAGFTGADLENVMNEASLLAARGKQKFITQPNIQEAIKRVIAGPEKKSRLVTEHDKRITAYHEAGHALLFHLLPNCDDVHEISIIPRGSAAGYVIPLSENDNSHVSKTQLLETITATLGGRAAEEIMLDDICTGAISDIEEATKEARRMITQYGMSDKIGPVAFGSGATEVFVGRDLMRSKDVSEEISSIIDRETKAIIDSCYERAKEIVSANKDTLIRVVQVLYDKEYLSGKDFAAIANGTYEFDYSAGNEGL